MLDIATRFEPDVKAKGRALAVLGLLVGASALPLAFLPSMSRPALVLAGVTVLVAGVALIGALGKRRRGRNIACTGAVLGVLAGITVLVVQATYAPGLPARQVSTDRVVAVAPKLPDVTVSVGRYGRAGVPVQVTNTALRLRSVDLTVEAVSPKGRRIATDTVSASLVPPGETATVLAFADEPGLSRELRTARFRLIETAQFG